MAGKFIQFFLFPAFISLITLSMFQTPQENKTNLTRESHFKSATWFSDYNAMLDSAPYFHIIHPFIYKLNGSAHNDGRLVSVWTHEQKQEHIAALRKKNPDMLILPTIFRWQNEKEKIREVIGMGGDESTMNFHIQVILSEIQKYGYDGIDIDYEGMECNQKEAFNNFVKKLSTNLHARGKLLSVSIHPRSFATDPITEKKITKTVKCNGKTAQVDFRETWRGPLAHDYVWLGKYADQVKIMAYEKHPRRYRNPGPGPQAPANWIEDVAEYATSKIPPEKLFMAIPTYGYDWSLNCTVPVKSVYYSDARRLIPNARLEQPTDLNKIVKESNKSKSWKNLLPFLSLHKDVVYDDPTLWYSKNGCDHLAFFMNSKSFTAKIHILKKYNLGGFSFWQLRAGNDPAINKVLADIYSGGSDNL